VYIYQRKELIENVLQQSFIEVILLMQFVIVNNILYLVSTIFDPIYPLPDPAGVPLPLMARTYDFLMLQTLNFVNRFQSLRSRIC